MLTLQGLDEEKCRQRNRISALRYGLETAELTLSALPRQVAEATPKPDYVRGSLWKTDEEALARINALLPEGATPLTLDQVHILPPLQAASNVFVGDRYLFLGGSTLRNIQREGEAGFAFMNSHRTGELSTPSELPFGKTFAGKYERYPAPPDSKLRPFERTQLGVYMLRGVYPNGTGGPSTDDMYRQIAGGVLSDVSMGLGGGQKMCDVCGWELRTENCGHAPGTSRNVSPEQMATQEARGVTRGRASYTLEDAHAGEVSGVYNGAIPGAGFSKALEFARQGLLSQSELRDMRRAYSHLFNKGDMEMFEQLDPRIEDATDSVADKVFDRLRRFFGWTPPTLAQPQPALASNQHDIYDQNGFAVARITTGPPIDIRKTELADTLLDATTSLADTLLDATTSALADQAAQEKLAHALNAANERVAALEKENRTRLANEVVAEFISDKHVLPAGVPAGVALSAFLTQFDSAEHKLEYQDNLGKTIRQSPLEVFRSFVENVPQHDLLNDHETPVGARFLPAEDEAPGDQVEAESRERARKHASQGRRSKVSQNGHKDE